MWNYLSGQRLRYDVYERQDYIGDATGVAGHERDDAVFADLGLRAPGYLSRDFSEDNFRVVVRLAGVVVRPGCMYMRGVSVARGEGGFG